MAKKFRLTDKPPSYYFVNKESIICTNLRAASTSMLKALNHRPRVTPERAIELREQGVEAVTWLRDPLERWACAFAIFGPNRGWSLSQFVEATFEQYNRHWVPQTTVHSECGIFVPTVVIPFEKLNETWHIYARGFSLMHTKKGGSRKRWPDLKKELSDEQIQRLMEYYDEDLALRAELNYD